MYEVIYTGQFKKSFKRCVRRGLEIAEFTTVLDILQEKGCLPEKYLPHKLQGKYKGLPIGPSIKAEEVKEIVKLINQFK